ncbi:hypothetical protein [Streptosporangium sandarakinum]|uniref:hypothetical protein n=1 Tax=Streptosporangium sandarakinum TaxID=1260955 RepID=UPI0033ADE961
MTFGEAMFSGSTVHFLYTAFADGVVHFGRTVFSGGELLFEGAKFSGSMVTFNDPEFSGGTVDFREVLIWSRPPVLPNPVPRGMLLPSRPGAGPAREDSAGPTG